MSSKQLETWRNNTAGRFVLSRLDGRGNRVDDMISGHRSFTVSPEERRMNQDAAATKEMDSFSNGTLVPVRLLDGEEDAAEIASNPNLLSDTDLKGLFRTRGEGFSERLSGISNPVTLQRLREMAVELDASIGQLAAIDARLGQIVPSFSGEAVVGPEGAVRTSAPEGRIRAVTPR